MAGDAGGEVQLESAQHPPWEHALRQSLWEGWRDRGETSIPLGPAELSGGAGAGAGRAGGARPSLELDAEGAPDPEVVGFAFPLPAVPFAYRNERRFPPPSDEEMFREMYRLVGIGLQSDAAFDHATILARVYELVGCNRRDGPRWQQHFIKANGVRRLADLWREWPALELQRAAGTANGSGVGTEDGAGGGKGELSCRYNAIAVFGRMLGTVAESRAHLMQEGVMDIILEAARDEDASVKDCAICAIKGVIQYPEGRRVVTYGTLIELLGLKG